jgi:hypothetical protein
VWRGGAVIGTAPTILNANGADSADVANCSAIADARSLHEPGRTFSLELPLRKQKKRPERPFQRKMKARSDNLLRKRGAIRPIL